MSVIQINQAYAFAAKHYKYNPVDTRRRFNVDTTSCVYGESHISRLMGKG